MKKALIKIALLIAAITLAGCGLMPAEPKKMYSGENLPLENVASISEGARLWLHVISIDGENVINPAIGAGPFTKGLHVLPGIHSIKVKRHHSSSLSMGAITNKFFIADITLETKPGHTYLLRSKPAQEGYFFWFSDMGLNYNQECLLPVNYTKIALNGEVVAGC